MPVLAPLNRRRFDRSISQWHHFKLLHQRDSHDATCQASANNPRLSCRAIFSSREVMKKG